MFAFTRTAGGKQPKSANCLYRDLFLQMAWQGVGAYMISPEGIATDPSGHRSGRVNALQAHVSYVVQDLVKLYRGQPSPANDGISTTIERGIVFGVLGPNGAGKTTFVRQLSGLLQPTSGAVSLLGQDIIRQPDIIPHVVAYYGQQELFLRAYTFQEVMWKAGILRGQTFGDARGQAYELLERFEATYLAKKVMARLSGGERRLAGLLATFMADRPIFILDEPTNDLDPRRRRLLWEYLHERNVQAGTTVIVVSHNLSEVEHVAHRALLIDKGRVVISGSIGDLKRAVTENVRIEVRLRRDDERARDVLESVDNAKALRPGVWEIDTEPSATSHILQRLLDDLGTDIIDDFRIGTSTLDDVYRHFTGVNDDDGSKIRGA